MGLLSERIKTIFSPVCPWGLMSSRFSEACTSHQCSPNHTSWLFFFPHLRPHSFLPFAWPKNLSSHCTITSMFPPNSNRSHLQTQGLSGSTYSELSLQFGWESTRSVVWHHLPQTGKVSRSEINRGCLNIWLQDKCLGSELKNMQPRLVLLCFGSS